jgi:hypothetical protein
MHYGGFHWVNIQLFHRYHLHELLLYYYYSSISACSPRAGTNNIHICASLLGKQKRGGDCRKTNRE